VGGGRSGSLSLLETTVICRELTGNSVEIASVGATRAGDVRCYLSDCTALFAASDWRPRREPRQILGDIFAWISDNEKLVRSALIQ
jgi:CDP-paratose 2-epimerase